jgi:uncharacterized protein involved in exopolysaccharide biosynthesis
MSIEDTNNINISLSDEISIADLINKVKEITKYLKSKWVTIFSFSLLGALLGLGYSILKKPTYTAVCTFVLEDSKSGGGLGQYAGLASLAGINIGGGGGGIFEGDNIIELYKSRTMIERALLSESTFNGKNRLLINAFIDIYRLQNNSNKKINEFNGNVDSFSRDQDSIINIAVLVINKKILTVTKPDKKLNIIKVEVETENEYFSKTLLEKLVQKVNEFYVQTKIKKASGNVQILQHQADSIRDILDLSIYGVANSIDASPNANPQLLTLKVASQKKQIDVQANTAIYSEIIKNLELSKVSLMQETPLIQIIDKPILPLKINFLSKLYGIAFGILMFFFLSIFYLSLRYLWR